MALLKRESDEEKAAKAAQQEADRAAKAERDAVERAAKDEAEFLKSAPGRARSAFQRGDAVFQYSLDVQDNKAVVVAMGPAYTKSKQTDPTDVLNAICAEGWDLVNGSFVFQELGSESRDKFMSSGQNVAVKGTVIGFYLFRRRTAG